MPPIYALAQQSFGIANHMLNMKWGILMAGIVVDLKTWDRIPKKYHEDLIEITHSIQEKYKETNLKAEQSAIDAMKKYGLTIHELNESEMEMWDSEVKRVSKYLRGNIIPEGIYDTVIRLTDK